MYIYIYIYMTVCIYIYIYIYTPIHMYICIPRGPNNMILISKTHKSCSTY